MRKSLAALIAAGLSLGLVACGSDSSETDSSADETTAATSGTLTVWVDETRIDAFNELGTAFAESSGVALDVVQKPSEDIKTDFIAQAPTGEGPDLIVGANDWTGDLVNNGVVAPVELGDAVDGLDEAAVQGFTMDGQLYGVPYAVENLGLVRNNALATDTPETFDELVTQGAGLAEFPVLIQSGESGDPYHLYPIQSSFGATVFETDDSGEYNGTLNMGGEKGEAFAEYLKKLADEDVLSADILSDQAKQAFLDGKSAYIVTGPWWTGEFQEAGLDISVVPFPSAGGEASAPFIGVQGVYLSANSENALLANQFLDYMAGSEAQTMLYELGGRTPALTEVAETIDDPILQGFNEAGAEGQPMPAIAEMGAVWTFWGETELSIINGQASDPAAAWDTMISNIESQF